MRNRFGQMAGHAGGATFDSMQEERRWKDDSPTGSWELPKRRARG